MLNYKLKFSLLGWVIWHCHGSDQIQWNMHSVKTANHDTYEDFLGKSTEAKSQH